MLRIEEVQFVNWGPLRPDTVSFLTHAVNLITGTNGSAKTCFVNGIKVLLGVRFPLGSEPREYIFNPITLALAEEYPPADQAILRGTFLNPVRPGGQRFFSWEGHEFNDVEHATVVCIVRRDGLRYRILPGRVKWDQPIAASFQAFFDEHPIHGHKWKGPKQYDEALSRMGVSQAMRGVLALPQGETGKILQSSPPQLLRTVLQLTGKQEIIDAYTSERKKFEAAQQKYKDTMGLLRLEQSQLKTRELEADRYLEWESLWQELSRGEAILLPAAKYRDAVAERDRLVIELDGLERRVRTDNVTLEERQRQVPALEEATRAAAAELDLARRARGAVHHLQLRLTTVLGNLERADASARQKIERAERLINGRTIVELNAMRESARSDLDRLRDQAQGLRLEIRDLLHERTQLETGQSATPPDVREFRAALDDAGIRHILLADTLEPGSTTARQAEAALGDAVWAVVVSPDDFQRAVSIAADREYPWPISQLRIGNPGGVLAGVAAPPDVGALLSELDLPPAASLASAPAGSSLGAAADGFVHRSAISQLRGPARSRIGREARAHRIEEIDSLLPNKQEEVQEAQRLADGLASELRNLDEAVELEPQKEDFRRVLHRVGARLKLTSERVHWARARWAELDGLTEKLARDHQRQQDELGFVRDYIEREGPNVARLRSQVDNRQEAARAAAAAVEQLSLNEEQRIAFDAGDLPLTSQLERDFSRLKVHVADDVKFPPNIRTQQVLADREEQRDVVSRATDMVGTAEADMQEQQAEIDRAREAYDRNVFATLRLLDVGFRSVCESAGVVGEIRRVAGDAKGEWGLDVLAAHKAGERPLSYQRRNYHSGGQTVKLAILLLLAAMSMGDEGSAEMLIMDEPIAHMSVENADQIADVIVGLKDRAQFVLAMPTNAETLRVDWADWQISLLAREAGQPHSPPAQILSSLDVDTEARFSLAQLLSLKV